ncbi:MAG: hypothetical protein Q9213_006906 [Squamulea squamosa]
MGRLNYTNVRGAILFPKPRHEAHTLIDSIKRIPPGTGSKSALRDPVVELDVTGRDLGEDGFQEVADALTRSLEYDSENGRVAQLEELCLKANSLSTCCLPALACIVRLAALDLRDLDISDNRFTIATNQDAEAWEDFLESFAECRVLRRLDLSGNPLTSKVFEVLARVYTREPAIVLMQRGDAGETLQSQTSSRRGTLDQTESFVRRTRNLSLASTSDSHSDDDHEGDVSAEESKAGHGIGHGWSTLLLVDGMVDRWYCQT